MALACPYCRHGVSFKDAKPGKYKPKCPKCEKRFLLTIPSDSAASPVAEPLPEANDATLANPGTLAASKGTGGDAVRTSSSASHGAATPDATLAQQVEATLPSAPAPAARSVAPSERTAPAVDATLPSASVAPTPSASGSPAGQAGTSVDQTMPQRAVAATTPGDRPPQRTQATGSGGTAHAAMPESLGGYKLLKELGRGAMGAVYLAKQLSLNRNVALKLIQAQWASNPTFVARFMREAYAAAQLTHHNVVQIYDLGAEGDTNYFSMEFVNGQSLSDLIAKQGPLDPRTAVGYILQAARGLQFAHQQGMVHRDVKPANLMVNDQGVVKVADLGLVKAPHLADDLDGEGAEVSAAAGVSSGSLAAAASNVTLANTAMGTPAYMAPEQAENATGVDHRADIYSLGCSLYVLLVGRPPFQGASALDVITQHKSKPITWPDTVIDKVPGGLSSIVMRMVAKKPDERYGNLAEVIADLEKFLHSGNADQLEQKKKCLQTLADAAKEFASPPTAKLRTLGGLAAVGGSCLLALLCMIFSLQASAGALACGVAAIASYFLLSGLGERTYLFDKARATLATLRWSDWVTALGGGLLMLAILALLGWLPGVLGGAICGGLAGAGWYLAITKPLGRRRAASIERAEGVLKELRLFGEDELAIQKYVVEANVGDGEEFFEALFGYETKLMQRAALSGTETGRRWKKYGSWRDGLIRRLDARITQARENRDRAKLQKIEEKSLEAKGIRPEDARAQAEAMAQAMVQAMLAQREQSAQPAAAAAPVDPRVAAAKKRERFKKMMAEARTSSPRRGLGALITGPLGFLLSGKLRFLAGCVLLIGFVLWLKQNGLLSAEQFKELNPTAHGLKDRLMSFVGSSEAKSQPLSWPIIGSLFSSFAPGLAGMILVVTGLCRGVKMSVFAWPAAAVVLFAPALGLSPMLGALVGSGLAVAGLLLGRSRAEA